ncbi:MAG: SMP-30/gluconolactonase/LRE family protein [Chryseolinea sp.]
MKHTLKLALLVLFAFYVIACKQKVNSSIGSIERVDPALGDLIDPGAAIEIIADGFEWSEGPLWIPAEKMLLFSDVPKNIVYKWTEANGKEVYLKPSGYTGTNSPYSGEEGSNGLTLNEDGKLVLCQHGDRRVSLMNASLNAPASNFTALVDNFQNKKLNSPNDAVFNKNGVLFFTDPPYGLPGQAEDTVERELPFHGIFKVANEKISLLCDSISRPNGIALFPGQRKLIVANSDPQKPIWYTFELSEKDSITSASIFYDATESARTDKGLPDGLKVDAEGNVFASGPGGIWIFDQRAKLLGKIRINELVSNCEFSEDGKTLYITADKYVLRVKLRS